MLDMQIRNATIQDAAGIARVHVCTWRSAYRGLMPDALIDASTYEQRFELWSQILRQSEPGSAGVFVAQVDDGEIAGFASGGSARSTDLGYAGELYALYVLQAYQGQGIGRALVHAVTNQMANLGIRSMLVWALVGGPANRFYAALGGRVLAKQPFEQDGYTLYEIGYGWDDTGALIALHV
jgi:GNAT superfamily N-acetyltransferase